MLGKITDLPIIDTLVKPVPHNSSKVVNHSLFLQGFQPMTLFSAKENEE